MDMTIFKKQRVGLACLIVIILAFSFSIYFAYAEPQGASISGTPSADSASTTPASSRNDTGGQIVYMTLTLEQQNNAWKAYVGNVTGSYVLKNSQNFSIYEWPLGTSINGEVYISRNSSVNWTTGALSCASNDEIVAEHAIFSMGISDSDNINNTFNSTQHAAFNVGTWTASGCRATALWVNDTFQQQNATTAVFQEIVLHDTNNIVYASLINNDKTGFDNRTTFDFQAIVPENRTSSAGTTYYFYVELGS